MDLRRILSGAFTVLGAATLLAASGVLTLTITNAALDGTWTQVIDFNTVGEGPMELVLAWALLPAVGWMLRGALEHEFRRPAADEARENAREAEVAASGDAAEGRASGPSARDLLGSFLGPASAVSASGGLPSPAAPLSTPASPFTAAPLGAFSPSAARAGGRGFVRGPTPRRSGEGGPRRAAAAIDPADLGLPTSEPREGAAAGGLPGSPGARATWLEALEAAEPSEAPGSSEAPTDVGDER